MTQKENMPKKEYQRPSVVKQDMGLLFDLKYPLIATLVKPKVDERVNQILEKFLSGEGKIDHLWDLPKTNLVSRHKNFLDFEVNARDDYTMIRKPFEIGTMMGKPFEIGRFPTILPRHPKIFDIIKEYKEPFEKISPEDPKYNAKLEAEIATIKQNHAYVVELREIGNNFLRQHPLTRIPSSSQGGLLLPEDDYGYLSPLQAKARLQEIMDKHRDFELGAGPDKDLGIINVRPLKEIGSSKSADSLKLEYVFPHGMFPVNKDNSLYTLEKIDDKIFPSEESSIKKIPHKKD